MKNRSWRIFSLPFFVALALLISSCGGSIQLGADDQDEIQVERNLLTGLPGANLRLLAVKIDDTRAAHPQVGIENADVIYIEQVEAGLTRLLAIYSSSYPIKVGPIRSARISDIDILAEYGRAGFAFSGAQQKMYPVIASANLANLGAQRNPPSVYFRDQLRRSPTNMFLYPDKLLEIDKNAAMIDVVKEPGWIFGEKPDLGDEIVSAKVFWPNAQYEVRWSKEEDRWLIFFNGEPNTNPEGYHLGSPTFIIQKVNITASSFGDKFGGVTPRHEVIGEGDGYLLRDGEIFPLKWKRSEATAPTQWFLANGAPAPFDRGQIWIALTNVEPSFEFARSTPSDG
jgi:hypothetical protein